MQKIKKPLIIGLLLILVTVSLGYFSYRTYVQKEFAQQLIRFHVLANSNSYEDQTIKLHVRDAVVNEMKHKFSQADNRQDAEQIVLSNLEEIKDLAQEQIKLSGKAYQVAVMLGNYDFPTKSYGNFTLPAGDYRAVRIVIGEGKGNNWWCVLFPPLCFVDSVKTLKDNETARGMKVFEKDNVEFRLKSADLLKIFS